MMAIDQIAIMGGMPRRTQTAPPSFTNVLLEDRGPDRMAWQKTIRNL
jgi:hypothetical protein